MRRFGPHQGVADREIEGRVHLGGGVSVRVRVCSRTCVYRCVCVHMHARVCACMCVQALVRPCGDKLVSVSLSVGVSVCVKVG